MYTPMSSDTFAKLTDSDGGTFQRTPFRDQGLDIKVDGLQRPLLIEERLLGAAEVLGFMAGACYLGILEAISPERPLGPSPSGGIPGSNPNSRTGPKVHHRKASKQLPWKNCVFSHRPHTSTCMS